MDKKLFALPRADGVGHSTAKQIRIIAAAGKGKNLLTEPRKQSAMLGVSLSKRFFSKEIIGLYCSWADKYCDRFLISIEDQEEMYNYVVFKNLTMEDARQRAAEQGTAMRTAFGKVLAGSNFNAERFTIQRSSALVADKHFCAIKEVVLRAFSIDKAFRDDAYKQLEINIGPKISCWRETVTQSAYEQGRTTLAQYLLEEIAVIIFTQTLRRYEVDIYPGPPMQILKRVYAGRYESISANVHLPAQYDYIFITVV